ncbi:MAG: DUF429 domain-containing protein [Rubrivivax sp.]|nr:DUF429 domain-containing protein [Rubrivivax sp.]
MMSSSLIGVDFTSAPTRRKPITVARGTLAGLVLRLDRVDNCTSFPAFEAALAEPGPWCGAFDFPFGLPRVFADALGLGASCAEVSAAVHARCATRMDFRALVDAWGRGLPHRLTDRALGPGIHSTSPLQTRYVPVGFMWFEGLSRLLAAGVGLPGLQAGDPQRLAFEGYPGALAHALIGRRSYKNSAEPDRLIARKDLVDALEQGRATTAYPDAPRLKLSHAMRDALVADTSGDRLDAVLCLVQAAWAQAQPGHGLPPVLDPVEGWILGAR